MMRLAQRTNSPPRLGARVSALTLIALLGFAVLGCEGDGSDGSAPLIRLRNTANCVTLLGGFPPGLTALPGRPNEAAVVQFIPAIVLGLNLEAEPPALLAPSAIPGFPRFTCGACGGLEGPDSDGDGEADACRSTALGFTCLSPIAGSLLGLDADLVALSTSSYEQLAFLDPQTGVTRTVNLRTPAASASFDPADWPFWPSPGVEPDRTAISTRACVYLPGGVDSLGQPLGSNAFCDPGREGFVTRTTAGAAFASDRLFVATSNLLNSDQARFAPGTVLVFEFDRSVDPPIARPDPITPILVTTGFNPTHVTPYLTPTGRELLLVNITGAIALGTGPNLVRTDSAIDVIDAATRRLIATIPLGRAGVGFGDIAIDSTGRIGLVGAATSGRVFGIDLATLDDPMLGAGPGPLPVVLDGSDPVFGDARVFDDASPFLIPRLPGGPSPAACTSQTAVATSDVGTRAVASDFCDGTLSVLSLSLPASRTTPIDPATALSVDRLVEVAAPLLDSSTGLPRAIEQVLIRPGRPGIDYAGPDVHYTLGQEAGAVCGVRIDSF